MLTNRQEKKKKERRRSDSCLSLKFIQLEGFLFFCAIILSMGEAMDKNFRVNPILANLYENSAWRSATEAVGLMLEDGETKEAQKLADETKANWVKEGKTDLVAEFERWFISEIEKSKKN